MSLPGLLIAMRIKYPWCKKLLIDAIIRWSIDRLPIWEPEKNKRAWTIVDDLRVRAQYADEHGRDYVEVTPTEYLALIQMDEFLCNPTPYGGLLDGASVFGKRLRINAEGF